METQRRAQRSWRVYSWPALVVAGAAVIYAGNRLGWWWLPIAVGVVAGLALRGGLVMTSGALLAALLGWGGDLALQARSVDIGGAAGVVAAILGLSPHSGGVVIGVTLAFAALLALGGVWLGASFRRAIAAFAPAVMGGW